MGCARVSAACVAALVLGGCELTEIRLATAEDVIIAEVVLRSGDAVQYAYLHRTTGTNGSARVPGALITVQNEQTAGTLQYEVVETPSLCLRPRPGEGGASIGTCYVARDTVGFVRPETEYSLRIEVENRILTGHLQVPGTFRLRLPAAAPCRLIPHRSLELTWTRAAGTWVYVAEGNFSGLRQALRQEGVDVPGDGPVELTGLSVSGADTTLTFPGEIGLFDRFDADLHPIVLALQNGLPDGVVVDMTIGASDRNYVNWVRGGTFNPSGQVRVPSIVGDGTGVFGAVVPVQLQIHVSTTSDAEPCG
jgi:hypothetical protein